MVTKTAFLTAIAFSALCSTAQALYSVADKGAWPESWPKELEPLRKQSRTFVGPVAPQPHYEIPFTNREEFESAWPKLLKVKSQGAPVFLVRGPTSLGGTKAGVWIHCPPPLTGNRGLPEVPLAGDPSEAGSWLYTTFLELVVNGNIVDLNRIPLPVNTPIIDKRFEKLPNQPSAPSGPQHSK